MLPLQCLQMVEIGVIFSGQTEEDPGGSKFPRVLPQGLGDRVGVDHCRSGAPTH